ncbi:MAG: hypothetical protein SPH68_01250 [Candidatus Borkfalkiaceae bacterium]|nr:hypothetical protein [Clostridia bacterium]MDY6222771.1 hypothetical protein [Christensenellaceae bacterium]
MENDQANQTLKSIARSAKQRIKKGFWKECEADVRARVEEAKKQGLNEEKAERYFMKEAQKTVCGEKEKDDEFYLRVKEMLLSEGETSDAIGRLTDKAYFDTLTYEEKQRYTLSLSEKYLRALERFRKESEFAVTSAPVRS